MTREEAIKHLSEWMDEKMWRCFGTIDREAIDMAIESLKAEPTEGKRGRVMNDLISRQAAIDAEDGK